MNACVAVQEGEFEADLEFRGSAIPQEKSGPQGLEFHLGASISREFGIHRGGFRQFQTYVERPLAQDGGTVCRHIQYQLLERVEVSYGKGAEPFGRSLRRMQT